jgi:uncharacterized phiE125 gp8 family phage protein
MQNNYSQSSSFVLRTERLTLEDDLVTLDEAKAHLEYADTDRDAYIQSLLMVATETLDGPNSLTGICFVPQIWKVQFSEPPKQPAMLPFGLPASVTAADVILANGDPDEVAAEDFRLLPSGERTLLTAGLVEWPELSSDVPYPISLTVTLDGRTIPATIKQAALLLVSHWFENREPASEKTMSEVPLSVSMLVDRSKFWFVK